MTIENKYRNCISLEVPTDSVRLEFYHIDKALKVQLNLLAG